MRQRNVGTRSKLWIGSACFYIFIAGCGSGGDHPPLGAVSGSVTVARKPAPNVAVQFSPVDGGRTSVGVTNANGKYRLMYTGNTRGALVGMHVVRLAPSAEAPSDDQLDLSSPNDLIPARYRGQTFEFHVKSGSNTFDVNLE